MQVFKDEQNEIICYYDENGDLMCEGWDEGPHFTPDPQQPTLRKYVRNFKPLSFPLIYLCTSWIQHLLGNG